MAAVGVEATVHEALTEERDGGGRGGAGALVDDATAKRDAPEDAVGGGGLEVDEMRFTLGRGGVVGVQRKARVWPVPVLFSPTTVVPSALTP